MARITNAGLNIQLLGDGREVDIYLPNVNFAFLVESEVFHYRVHKNTSLYPALNHVNTFHNFTPCFSDIIFNIILQSNLSPKTGVPP
jgi:hypothetical protein